jgi:hypothetical protein
VITQLVSFGIIPHDAQIKDACYANNETEACNGSIRSQKYIDFFEDTCMGQKSCSFDISPMILKEDSSSMCVDDYSRFFTQVHCKIPTTEEMDKRKSLQMILVWTIILSAIIYFFGLEWYDYYSDKHLKNYDQSTTTSSDFTCEYILPKGMYDDFKTKILPSFLLEHKKISDIEYTPLAVFKQYLINGIRHVFIRDNPEESGEEYKDNDENVLNDLLEHLSSNWPTDDELSSRNFASLPKNVNKIADINFTFDNREMLNLLTKRGSAVENKEQSKVNLIQKEIDDLVGQSHERLTTPLSAFITFETEKGYLTACKMNMKQIFTAQRYKQYWGDYPLYFKPAKEPDTIVWENYGISQKEKCCKSIVVILAVLLIIGSAFAFFFYSQKYIYDYMNVYPNVD